MTLEQAEKLYGLEMGRGWWEERGPCWETGHSAADQRWDPGQPSSSRLAAAASTERS